MHGGNEMTNVGTKTVSLNLFNKIAIKDIQVSNNRQSPRK